MKFPAHYFSQQIVGARYYCPTEPASGSALAIVCAGWENCRPDYKIHRLSFPWQAVELVVKGEGWLQLGDRPFRLRPGILFRYGPETEYEMKSDPERPLQKYFVDCTGSEARRTLSKSPLQSGQVRQALYPQELQDLFDRIIVEGNRTSKSSREIAINYLRLLFQKLDQCTDLSPGHGPSRSLSSYLRSKAFLDENYVQLANMEQAATRLGMTPETLCRLFRRFSPVSPHQYLVHLRINLAVDLLLGTDLLTKQIGEEVGFSDPFHFSRVFKRIQGLSPDTFRRLRRPR